MKRTPMVRKTPLTAKPKTGWTPPEPTPIDLAAAADALARRQAALETPRAEHAPVPPVSQSSTRANTGAFKPTTRQVIIDRDNYTCQRCGRAVDGDGWPGYSLQHRNARGMGGTDDPRLGRPANGVLMCGSATTGCHGWAESNPRDAERTGFAVASWADPTTVPMLTFRGWVLVDDHGRSWPTPAPPSGDAHAAAQRVPRSPL